MKKMSRTKGKAVAASTGFSRVLRWIGKNWLSLLLTGFLLATIGILIWTTVVAQNDKSNINDLRGNLQRAQKKITRLTNVTNTLVEEVANVTAGNVTQAQIDAIQQQLANLSASEAANAQNISNIGAVVTQLNQSFANGSETFAGEYSNTTVYEPGQYVIYNNQLYFVLRNSSGILPTNTSYFEPLDANPPVPHGEFYNGCYEGERAIVITNAAPVHIHFTGICSPYDHIFNHTFYPYDGYSYDDYYTPIPLNPYVMQPTVRGGVVIPEPGRYSVQIDMHFQALGNISFIRGNINVVLHDRTPGCCNVPGSYYLYTEGIAGADYPDTYQFPAIFSQTITIHDPNTVLTVLVQFIMVEGMIFVNNLHPTEPYFSYLPEYGFASQLSIQRISEVV